MPNKTAPVKKRIAYVVTAGSYSDYSIYGVFDDRAVAQAFCDEFNASARYGDPLDIEEWELNPATPQIRAGLHPYFIRISRDGMTSGCERGSSVDEYIGGVSDGTDMKGNRYFHLWASDEQHAAKIANERRVALIASGAWK